MDKQALKCFIMGLTECSDKVVRRSREEPTLSGFDKSTEDKTAGQNEFV